MLVWGRGMHVMLLLGALLEGERAVLDWSEIVTSEGRSVPFVIVSLSFSTGAWCSPLSKGSAELLALALPSCSRARCMLPLVALQIQPCR